MVFTREVLESYYKFLSSHVLSLPDTVVALFSVAQQKPDMYPYWLDPQDYSDCFYDFWIFMNFYYKENKSEFYNLVKNMEFLSEKIWNEFIREDTIDNLFKYHFQDLGNFLSVLLHAAEDNQNKVKLLNCNNAKYFMNLLSKKYKEFINPEKHHLFLNTHNERLFFRVIENDRHIEISTIINKYLDPAVTTRV